jgi:hypothetical protein
MANKQTSVLVYLAAEKRDELRALAKRTRVLQSVLLREAVDDLLAKYRPTNAPREKGVRAK